MATTNLLHGKTREIQLGDSGLNAIVDEELHGFLVRFNWYPLSSSDKTYAQTVKNGETILMHRLVLWADKLSDVDHVNGNGLDNRIVNLRQCTTAQNLWNQKTRRNNTSGFKGVSYARDKFRTKPWHASIMTNGRRKFIGFFSTPEEASVAYENAGREQRGEFHGGGN